LRAVHHVHALTQGQQLQDFQHVHLELMFMFLLEGFTIFTTCELYSKLKVMAAYSAEMPILDYRKDEAQLDHLIVLSQRTGCIAEQMPTPMP
jgi:hypothetical protein